MKSIIFALFVLYFLPTQAQVKTNFNNLNVLKKNGYYQKNYKNNYFTVTPPDSSKLIIMKLVDKNERSPKPFRFAAKIKANINLLKEMNWITESQYSYGKFSLIVPKAKSLNVFFDSFYLPENTEMYVYNNHGIMISGPITSNEDNQDSVWVSTPLKGDTINIEIELPTMLMNALKLNISVIGYGYQDIFSTFCCGFGQSGLCEINVLCPLGNNWANQRSAVARVIGNQGTSFFSGEMIMNTCNTNIPYFLTAWHVLDNYISSWQFLFQYWSPTCLPSQNTANTLQFNGASLMASNMPSDFALVRLNQTPSNNSNITYLGWNRSPNAALNSVGIHHPQGDVMKISSDQNPPILAAFNAPPFNSNALNWWRAHFQQGTVEPGSSGSALFDQNQRVVGQLTGNPDTQGNYCAEQIGEYGRFDLSWTGDGTNATRLSNWLDPGNTGAVTTNTTNVSNLINAYPSLSISGNLPVCTSASYTLNGVTTGTVTWSSSNTSIATVTSPGNPATVTKRGNGSLFITGTVTFCPGTSASVTKPISAGVANNYYIQNIYVYPNPPAIDVYSSFTGQSQIVTSWAIAVDGVVSRSDIGYPPFITTVNGGTSCGTHTVTLTTYNSCGSYSVNSQFTRYSGCYGYTLTPNPANSAVTITSTAPSNSKIPNSNNTVEIIIFDQANRPLKHFSFTENSQYNISLAGLLPGAYIIQIKDGDTVDNLKLIKQ